MLMESLHPWHLQDVNFSEFETFITVLQNFLMSLIKLLSLFFFYILNSTDETTPVVPGNGTIKIMNSPEEK